MKKKICWVSADDSACCKYRCILPATYLKEYFDTSYTVGFDPSKMNHYYSCDIVILQRHCHPHLLEFINQMHKLGKEVWFDIDDLLWDIPYSNIAHRTWNKLMLTSMADIVKRCDHVTTSTSPLATYLKRFNQNVHVIPNMVEDLFVDKKKNDKVKMMWAGSYTHAGDFDSGLIHSLDYVLKRYDIELYFMGYLPDKFVANNYNGKVQVVDAVPIDEYISTLQDVNPDICFAPLASNHFNVCKSNLKYLENTLAGAISICSDIYPYKNIIEDNVNGYIYKKSKDLISTLEALIEDDNLRDYIYQNSKNFVLNNYIWDAKGINTIGDSYSDIIKYGFIRV